MNSKEHLIIGIAGGSGSGKTTFLKAILCHFTAQEITLVSQDNYYKTIDLQEADHNGVINFDLPTSIDRDLFYHNMMRLKNNESIEKSEYHFNNSSKESSTVIMHPAPVIIMEGLFVFHYDEIREQLHHKVYIEAHHETRLERRIRRDAEERGYPENEVRYQWENHVRPAEQLYLEPFKASCDLVVDNSHSFDDGLIDLKNIIRNFLNQ